MTLGFGAHCSTSYISCHFTVHFSPNLQNPKIHLSSQITQNSNSDLRANKSGCVQDRRGGKEVEQADRISDLPDHVIGHVLSLLGTQEAIRTCILSTRWRYLWRGITHICLQGFDSDPYIYSNLVDHVLQNCSSTDFVSFELSCPIPIKVSCINSWTGSLHSRKIEKLVLCANNADEYVMPKTSLPKCVLSYSMLVVLKLACFDIQIPDSIVCLPRLKSLDIQVIFRNRDVVNRLLSCCPVLETLHLFGFVKPCKELNIDISVSTLRKLRLRLNNVRNGYKKKHDVIINAPNLEDLYIDDDSSAQYVVKNIARGSSVIVNYDVIGLIVPEHMNRLLDLFKGIAVTGVLTLLWSILDVLRSALTYTWPTFPYLTTLIVHLSAVTLWTCVTKLIQSAPSLEVLILDLEAINDDDYRRSDDIYNWAPPDSVPYCLLEHHKIIGIQCFGGNEDELLLVLYLLNNALVLERMMIGFDPDLVDEEVVQKLLTFPRASKTCEVLICERVGFDIHSPNKITVWGT